MLLKSPSDVKMFVEDMLVKALDMRVRRYLLRRANYVEQQYEQEPTQALALELRAHSQSTLRTLVR
jgi:hypothetical protein